MRKDCDCGKLIGRKQDLGLWSRTLLTLLIVVGFLGEAVSQDTVIVLRYPSASNVNILLECSVAKLNRAARYSYELKSMFDSQQRVGEFFVDIESEIDTIISPNHWRGAKSHTRRAVMWFSRDSTADIPPGGRLGGFNLLSRGLPAIGIYYARGYVPIPEIPFGQTPDSIIGYDVFQNSFKGWTVTPKTVREPPVVADVLDTLLSYTRQSAELGWLGKDRDNGCDDDERPEDGVVKNIEKRLEKTKRHLERDDSLKARRELEKLVQKVERIWKRSQDQDKKRGRGKEWKQDTSIMTSEAYALLKYNTKYLIDHLSDKQPKRGKTRERE